ncbi:hypothetical protein GCM10010911_27040 [Paenibacillus nasutitermitis]|uniref:FtsK domain-containing protein n=1 Tax=Paenibacillus nasutitermitis TaxID=1652958 RepID=A0A917DTN1_9BACL|nr:hypothetical protein GCM10010911_27040 [Paenibacillus nasutitermitis]
MLITLSVIALSGEATVGRSLSKLFGLMLGKFYFVLALVGIYVGLSVMIKRVWPSGWSTRKTGILLLVLAFTLMSSITVMDQKTEPTGGLTSGYILTQLGGDIRASLIDSPAIDDGSIAPRAVSGGYAGAIQYTLLYWLFGYFGAKFIMIVMFAISIMLMTGKSYVDLIKALRVRGGRLLSLLSAKLAAKRASHLAASPAKQAGGVKGAALIQSGDLDDEDEDEDLYRPRPRTGARKKLAFFSWFNDKSGSEDPQGKDEWQMEDEPPVEGSGANRKRAMQWEIEEEEGVDKWGAYNASESDSAAIPDELDELLRGGQSPAFDSSGEVHGKFASEMSAKAHLNSDKADEFAAEDEDGEEEFSSIASPSSPLVSPAIETGDPLEGGEAQGAAVPRVPAAKPYQLPSLSLLVKPSGSGRAGEAADANDSRRKLEATLESFGVRAKVLDVVRGPAVTRYEVQPATGVKVSRIVGLTDDIALALAAKDIRMEAPIPGKSAIGIEVPNTEVSVVTMREVMEMPAFLNAPSKLSIAFGRDISGQTIVGNLAKMPHLLVAGATGSGKSVCINGIITSILYKARPDEVKFLMVDPKMVELNVYNGIPHLLAPVVTDPKRASLALKKIVVEMEKRYELFSKSGTRNIEGYNNLMVENPSAVLPYIVVIVDELADLMMVAANDVEDAICRLAQMARAAGIHLIIATQRPSVDVITGLIKANIPSRIAFGVSSQVDSRTILDMVGAEKLLGRGDMLFLPVGMSKPIRVQGAFLSDQEVEAVVNYSRGQAEAEYTDDLVPEVDDSLPDVDEQIDELYDQAVRIVLEAKQASVSLLQRRMRVGYTRAARLIDQMEARNIIGPYEGSKPREVLLTIDQYDAGKISS